MKSVYKVFKWTGVVTVAIIFILPFLSKNSYVEFFDSVSIPIVLGGYALFWIIFKLRSENLELKLLISTNNRKRLNDLHKITNESIVLRLNECDSADHSMTMELRKTKENSKLIDYILRMCAVLAAIFKVFQYFLCE